MREEEAGGDPPPNRRSLHKQSAGLGDGSPGGGPHNQRQGPRVACDQAPAVPVYLASSVMPLDPLQKLPKAIKRRNRVQAGGARSIATCFFFFFFFLRFPLVAPCVVFLGGGRGFSRGRNHLFFPGPCPAWLEPFLLIFFISVFHFLKFSISFLPRPQRQKRAVSIHRHGDRGAWPRARQSASGA